MPVWVSRALVVVACVGLVALPALAHRGERAKPTTARRPAPLERVLVALMGIGFLLALVWATTPLLSAADYEPHPVAVASGAVAYALGLLLLYRSHRDLASQWSLTLGTREEHSLVTHGVYRRLRHPMYLALLLCGMGQLLVVSNFVAGPAYLAAALLLVSLRIATEERMMAEAFGDRYRAYAAQTRRLVPGLW
jgi:protein-S-isoprenylcysteine O-methyltransferase Ste14